MRVLVVTTFYAPDLGPGAALFTMLCEDLARLGHEVSVIAAVPHYPTGRVSPEYRGALARRETINGVDVTRLWVPSVDRSRLWQRLATFAVFQVLSAFAGVTHDYDILIAGNPALEVFLPFWVLATLRRRPALFSIHDLYPDVGVRLGIFRQRVVIGAVRWMENYCLRRAACVRVLSEGFREWARARGVQDSKIALIWDWLDSEFVRPLPKVNRISSEWALESSFVVMYAGNMSFSQGLESVLDAAKLLRGNDIRFVFVGDGAARASLQARAASAGLTNVSFFPFQAREALPEVLASADVSLVCLRRGIASDSVPSKFYSILASGRPVAAAVDEGSDTWNLVQKAACGVAVAPEEPEALAAAIRELYCDPARRAELGANGRAYVVRNHSRAAAAAAFHRAICSVCEPPAATPDASIPREASL